MTIYLIRLNNGTEKMSVRIIVTRSITLDIRVNTHGTIFIFVSLQVLQDRL